MRIHRYTQLLTALLLLIVALMLFTSPALAGGGDSSPSDHAALRASQPQPSGVVMFQTPIEVSDVVTPETAPQASHGQVSARVRNTINQTFEGFAYFADNSTQITSTRLNFTLGPFQELKVVVDYQVAYNATVGPHMATFEVNVGGFAFLFYQYQLEVIPVAAITSFMPAQVFTQGQSGILLAVIENRGDQLVEVQLDLQGPNFAETSQQVTLIPGSNMVALSIKHEATHVYDFGMCPVNLTMYYLDEVIDSTVTIVPVDMTSLNKALGVVLPVVIFEGLVVFYAYRKRQRLLASRA